MSYPRDLDDYTEAELLAELKTRESRRAAGLCDYCCRYPHTSPPCRYPERHVASGAADTEEGQTERIEGSATGRDGCFSFYASGRSFLSGGAPVYRATLLVHRERCTDSQSGGQGEEASE